MSLETNKDIVKYEPTTFQRMISSCCGALLVSLFVTPLDVIKIKLQAQEKDFAKSRCYVYCNGLMDHLCFCEGRGPHAHHMGRIVHRPPPPPNSVVYRGTLDTFTKIVKYEGPTGLWNGLSPTLVIAVPSTVIYFTSYDLLKRHFTSLWGENFWTPGITGVSARVAAVTVVSPLELVRTRMTYEKISYQGVHLALKHLVQHQGILSLWKGIGPSLFRDVPFSGIYWTLLESLKSRYPHYPEIPFWYTFLSGAVAGSIAATITLPFDVVKTHRQIELGSTMHLQGSSMPTSMIYLIRNLYVQRGLRGLFAGIVPRVIKVAPACAIMISVYDYSKALFTEFNMSQGTDQQ